jgi:hypothetical protein
MTRADGDLVAYGILTNHDPKNPAMAENTEIKGVAVCENMQSTVHYRAFLDLN